MSSIIDEWMHITKGNFIILMLIVPLVTAAVFGYIFKNSTVEEAPLAVIDLDHSSYSQQLINKLDASQYIEVGSIYDNNIEADQLLYNEKYSGVLYLPAGLEAAYLQGQSINVGLYLDMTMTASANSLRTGVSEVIGVENASKGLPTMLALEQRSLYNPTNRTIMGSVILFLNVITLILIVLNTISIVPRLREEGRLQEELQRPLGLLFRTLPYALISCVSIYLVMGVLKQVAGLRFEADPLQIFVPFFLYTLSTSLLSMLVGWTAPIATQAKVRLIFLVLPSLLLSGAQVPYLLLPEPLQSIYKLIPLSLHFKFLRGMGYKGGNLRYFIPDLGQYIVIISIFLLCIFLLILKEVKNHENLMSDDCSLIL